MSSRIAILLAAFSLALTACLGDSVVDNISTELTVTTPGPPGTPLEIRKRFRFSHDPRDARGVYFSDGWLRILAPVGGDLSFLQRVEVYVVHPEDGPVLVASGDGFQPGDRTADFDIVYEEDLRPFASDDSRVTFSFMIESAAWSRPYPEGGFTVLASAEIEIDI